MKTWFATIKLANIKSIIYLLLVFFLMSSCRTPKKVTYFKDLKNLDEITTIKNTTIYKSQDVISIVVSAPDPNAAIPFNSSTGSSSSENLTASATNGATYLIDSKGFIYFPIIGQLKISGLSSDSVKDMIQEKLKTYIKNPTVTVQLKNFRVNVLGEVNNPGPLLIEKESVTLLEAISYAGDLGIQGKRTNITVIRENNNKRTVYKADLTSKDIFNSPVFFLSQNDTIYVEPNDEKKKETANTSLPRVLSYVSSILGILISVIILTR